MLTTATIAAFGLYLVRTGALFVAAPVLGTGAAFSGYRISLVFAISFLLFGSTGADLSQDLSPIVFGIMALRELMIGLSLAFVLILIELIARMAGDLIGNQMGLGMANQADPITGVQTALVSRIYDTIFLIGFLAVDGHHVLLRALADSFQRAPVGRVNIELSIVDLIVQFFGETFKAGITFAAPVMIFLMLLSVLIGVLARVVPQINVLEMGFTLRVALSMIAMYIFAPIISPALMHIYDLQSEWLSLLLDGMSGEVVTARVIGG
jgi:flagellar biosynthesis protein FliR